MHGQMLRQCKAVHSGHLDIRNDQRGNNTGAFYQFKRLSAVFGISNHLEKRLVLTEFFTEILPEKYFILHYQTCIFHIACLLS